MKFDVTDPNTREEVITSKVFRAIERVSESLEPNEDGWCGPVDIQIAATNDGTVTIEVPNLPRKPTYDTPFEIATDMELDEVRDFSHEFLTEFQQHVKEGEAIQLFDVSRAS